MIYPITVYGLPVLKKVATEITPDYPNLSTVIEDMYKTLTNAEGVGLAAPQVNLSIKLFIVDLTCLAEENPIYKDFKKTFINPLIITATFDSECVNSFNYRIDLVFPVVLIAKQLIYRNPEIIGNRRNHFHIRISSVCLPA